VQGKFGLVSGHGFSRAAIKAKSQRALALAIPAGPKAPNFVAFYGAANVVA